MDAAFYITVVPFNQAHWRFLFNCVKRAQFGKSKNVNSPGMLEAAAWCIKPSTNVMFSPVSFFWENRFSHCLLVLEVHFEGFPFSCILVVRPDTLFLTGRELNRSKIQHFNSRYNNWPDFGYLIQYKTIRLLPCCQILHMVLQSKESTPKKRKVS